VAASEAARARRTRTPRSLTAADRRPVPRGPPAPPSGLRSTALFSVSLTAADDTDDARRVTRELIDDLVDASDWTPTLTAAFAGAFQYREYDVFTRTLMRLIADRHEITTDISADVELTDWLAVDAFADRFAATLAR
jgi:menaquinone-dependent protoporphyrinogen oxidase